MTDGSESPAKEKRGVNIQAVSRAIMILRCFQEKRELSLTEISTKIGLHKSTTAGLVNTMKSERFLEQNPKTGKLQLGLGLFTLAACAKIDLVDICEGHLTRLVEITGETVNLAVRDGNEIVYVAKKESPHSMRISTSVGQRLPLHCTAIGKALTAFSPDRNRILSECGLRAYTDRTIVDRDKLQQELDKIRAEVVSYDIEELEYGLTCVAIPILNGDREPLGAISVSGPSVRMDSKTCDRIVLQLRQAVSQVDKELSRLTT